MRFLFFLLIAFIPVISLAQASDFISVKKKNNRTIKSYFPGSPITCETVYGSFFHGYVEAIRNDSVFIKQYDIRQMPTQWGTPKIDTVGTYVSGIHYTHIRIPFIKQKQSFGFIRSGTIFIIGGLGYAALNLINGQYLDEPTADKENKKKLGIALGVAGTGFLLKYLNKRGERKKYKVVYIKMTLPKPRGA